MRGERDVTHGSYRNTKEIPRKWSPRALQPIGLLAIILVSSGLIACLQALLNESKSKGGIFFAIDLNTLPWYKTFAYMYLPTVLAVIYSLWWTWIDLDSKRLEPYYQLSKPGGALGKDSLLLHYPFDFIATVPVAAFRRRHWPVFFASIALVFVFWGLTPAQAGIFATDTITKTLNEQMLLSKSTLPLSQQQSQITAEYMYSVYGLMWLNETLPSYMSREFILAPFKLGAVTDTDQNPLETWTARTKLYSLDMACEEAQILYDNETKLERHFTSTSGCKVLAVGFGPDGNQTIGTISIGGPVKEFTPFFAGYDNKDGFADFYLSPYCPLSANRTFFTSFSRNKHSPQDSIKKPTRLFCQPNYYVQEVNATVKLGLHKSVTSVDRLGPKLPIPDNIFNLTDFGWQLASAVQKNLYARSPMPATKWPPFGARLKDRNLSFGMSTPSNTLFSLPVGAYQVPDEEYLKPEVLKNAWEAAYRLLFARSMSNVLLENYTDPSADQQVGIRVYQIQAVVVDPIFTHIVQALLGAATLSAAALLFFCIRRKYKISFDPCTMASLMSLCADDLTLLQRFYRLDQISDKEMISEIKNDRYELVSGGSGMTLQILSRSIGSPTPIGQSAARSDTMQTIRPQEYRFRSAIVFLFFNLSILVTLVTLFVIGRRDGLTMPSPNRFARQFLENYLPTVLATLIEPIWVLVTRTLCLLQPFEQLRNGEAKGKNSIDLDYNSLPPQLVFWKALRSRHFTLAMVCAMALLANLLAVAFSGLFNESNVTVSYPTVFKTVDPILDGFNSSNVPDFYNPSDNYVRMVSNFTGNTLLPAWSDPHAFYVPFTPASSLLNETVERRTATRAFRAKLDCTAVPVSESNGTDLLVYLDQTINLRCLAIATLNPPFTLNPADMLRYGNCSGVPTANELVSPLYGIKDASSTDDALCRQHIVVAWARTPGQGRCRTNTTIDADDITVMACKPRILTGSAEVRVDQFGRVEEVSKSNINDTAVDIFFRNNSASFLPTLNDIIVNQVVVTSWHNDSFPSELINYYMTGIANSTAFLDPVKPPPSMSTVTTLLEAVYARFFALHLSLSIDKIIPPVTTSSRSARINVQGVILQRETRILISYPLFGISVATVTLYIFVTVLAYIRRPARFLPRLPTTIASVLAAFASSHAVLDFKGTAGMTKKERSRLVRRLDHQYGFGAFVGVDGVMHVGIEKQPFLGARKRPTRVGSMEDEDESRFEKEVGLVAKSKRWLTRKSTYGWKGDKIHQNTWI